MTPKNSTPLPPKTLWEKGRKGSGEKERAKELAELRGIIELMCLDLMHNESVWANDDEEFANGVRIFLDIHKEFPRSIDHVPMIFRERVIKDDYSSKFLISDIPKSKKGEKKIPNLLGLNKPKMRHWTNNPPVGKDGG